MVGAEPCHHTHFRAIHSPKFAFANLLMLMMSFDDALTRANFSFAYFLKFYLVEFFDIFQWGGGLNPQTPTLATPLTQRICERSVHTTDIHCERHTNSTSNVKCCGTPYNIGPPWTTLCLHHSSGRILHESDALPTVLPTELQ